MTITLTWALFWLIIKWSGLVLIPLSCVALFLGDLPDSEGSDFWNAMRLPVFGGLILWGILIFLRGLFG